jgi:hypothetical protein
MASKRKQPAYKAALTAQHAKDREELLAAEGNAHLLEELRAMHTLRDSIYRSLRTSGPARRLAKATNEAAKTIEVSRRNRALTHESAAKRAEQYQEIMKRDAAKVAPSIEARDAAIAAAEFKIAYDRDKAIADYRALLDRLKAQKAERDAEKAAKEGKYPKSEPSDAVQQARNARERYNALDEKQTYLDKKASIADKKARDAKKGQKGPFVAESNQAKKDRSVIMREMRALDKTAKAHGFGGGLTDSQLARLLRLVL